MRTVQFKTVLWTIARKMGYDPTSSDFDDETAAKYAAFATTRLQEAWEHDFWPELMLLEQRAMRDDWDNALTYALGDEVFYRSTEVYYIALQASTGQDPTSTSGFWEVPTTFDPYIPYEMTNRTALGDVEFVCQKNPRTNQQFPGFLITRPSENGIQLSNIFTAQSWIQFRQRPPELTSAVWDDSVAYLPTQLVYSATSGECYIAIQAGTNQDPVTPASAYWTKIDFPYIFRNFVIYSCYADALDEDGQQDKSSIELDRAYNELERIAAVQIDQQRIQKQADYRGY